MLRYGFDFRLPPDQPAAPGGCSKEQHIPDVGISATAGAQECKAWHRLDDRLAGGDTLVVVAIDRIGRTWQDTIRSICELREVMLAACVADQELQSVKRRTKEGLGRPRQ